MFNWDWYMECGIGMEKKLILFKFWDFSTWKVMNCVEIKRKHSLLWIFFLLQQIDIANEQILKYLKICILFSRFHSFQNFIIDKASGQKNTCQISSFPLLDQMLAMEVCVNFTWCILCVAQYKWELILIFFRYRGYVMPLN